MTGKWLLFVGFFVAGVALTAPSLAEETSALEERLFRIDLTDRPLQPRQLWQLQTLGLDIAGFNPKEYFDFIGTDDDRRTLEHLGYTVAVRQETLPRKLPASADSSPFGAFHSYGEVVTKMNDYAARFPDLAQVSVIGSSVDGRDILAMKISDEVTVDDPDEPNVLLMGCHHSRELISVEIPVALMEAFLDDYGTDPYITRLVDEREIWLVPIVNPDGWEYVRTTDIWWRKNRRNNGDGTRGVDPNRNYAFEWGRDNIGSSPIGWDETYRGGGPFSEPETQAVRDLALDVNFSISASYHSYGRLLLFPWGYKAQITPDHLIFRSMSEKLTSRNNYTWGNVATGTIYLTNGDSEDWLYGDTVDKPQTIAFTWEVGTSFHPPESQIGQVIDEVFMPSLWMTEMAGEAPFIENARFDDSLGNGDGDRSPGEELAVQFDLRNLGLIDIPNLEVTMTSASPDVTILSAPVVLGSLPSMGAYQPGLGDFSFRPAASLGTGTDLTLHLELRAQGRLLKRVPLLVSLDGAPLAGSPSPTVTPSPTTSPTISPTSTATATPSPTVTPTSSPTPQPTATATATPTPPPAPTASPTPTVAPAPGILAGYALTDVTAADGGTLHVLAFDPSGSLARTGGRLVLGVSGVPIGLELRDDGSRNDGPAGDDLYGYTYDFAPGEALPGTYLLELSDSFGEAVPLYPYLTIN